MGSLKYERFINLKLKSSDFKKKQKKEKEKTGPYEKFVVTSSMVPLKTGNSMKREFLWITTSGEIKYLG